MVYRLLIVTFALFFLLTSCTGLNQSDPTAISSTVTPNQSASPSLTPFRPSAYTSESTLPVSTITSAISTETLSTSFPISDVIPPRYILNAVLDYAAHSLTVDETIIYQNSTGQALNELVLAVEPNLWAGCFILGTVMVNDQGITGMELNGDQLEIPLSPPLFFGEEIHISLHYDLHLPPADIHQVFGYNNLQINLVDWFPFVVPYSDGWVLHPPAEVGEHLTYDLADFDVKLSLADPELQVILAVSSPSEAADGSWHYLLENARTFAISASTAYQSTSAVVGGVTVMSYYYQNDKVEANAVLDETAKALTTFGKLFGSYPFSSLAIVESPYFDGMEYSGLFFLSRDYYHQYDGTVLNYLVDIAVHETAHQWWFGLVGNDQALEPWLDEALATYSENLFYEENYPEVTSWWTFRVNAYSPTGWVDTDIYHAGKFRPYTNAAYFRGAQFLDAVRGRIGDEAFFAFLKDYAAQMSGKLSTARNFFWILRQNTNVDISDLITGYFKNSH